MDVINLTTVPKDYLEPIINFLYDNDTQFIRKQNYNESFLYHLMEICDQFFVNRLKNIIELIMIEKMSAKKCGDMFEFSQIFNCELLESVAIEYICQNMGRLLENHFLNHLQIENLEQISKCYAKMFHFSPNESYITLNDESISDESVISFIENFRIDITQKNVQKTTKSPKPRKTSQTISERRNYEKESTNLLKNLSLDTSDNDNKTTKSKDDKIVDEAKQVSNSIQEEILKWVKVTDKKDLKKKSFLAAVNTNAIIKNEPKEPENFTPLKGIGRQMVEETSDLDYSIESANDKSSLQFHLSLGDFTPLKIGKISQKQRKRQFSQSENTTNDKKPNDIWTKPSPVTPIELPNAWNLPTTINDPPMVTSTPVKTQPINIKTTAGKRSTRDKIESISFTSPSTSAQSISIKSSKMENSFSKILEDERKQKEYFNKMKSKSLLLTQIEEIAIDELKKFYNVDDVFDEFIEIERQSAIKPTVNFAEWKYHN